MTLHAVSLSDSIDHLDKCVPVFLLLAVCFAVDNFVYFGKECIWLCIVSFTFWLQVCAVSFGEFCGVIGRQSTEENLVGSVLNDLMLLLLCK